MYGMKVPGSSEASRPAASVGEVRTNKSNMENIRSIIEKKPSLNMKWFVICLFVLWLFAFSIGTAALIKIVQYEQEFGLSNEGIMQAKNEYQEMKHKEEWIEKELKNLSNRTDDNGRKLEAKISAMFQAESIKIQSEKMDWKPGSKTLWSFASEKCETYEKRLCSNEEIFPPNAQSKAETAFEGKPRWVPISNDENSWTLIGGQNRHEANRIYRSYSDGPPIIGQKEARDISEALICCVKLPKP